MKKKLIIIITAVVLGLAVLIVGSVVLFGKLFASDNGAADTVISVGTAEGSVGDTVKVPVKISSNPGFMAMLLDFEYDTEALKYISHGEGDFLTDYDLSDNDGSIKFITLENSDVDDDGVLLYLEFEILSDKSSESEIKLVIGENSICNYDEEIITAKAENGSVKIN